MGGRDGKRDGSTEAGCWIPTWLLGEGTGVRGLILPHRVGLAEEKRECRGLASVAWPGPGCEGSGLQNGPHQGAVCSRAGGEGWQDASLLHSRLAPGSQLGPARGWPRAGSSPRESFSQSEPPHPEGAARTDVEPPILGGMQAEAALEKLVELQLSQ